MNENRVIDSSIRAIRIDFVGVDETRVKFAASGRHLVHEVTLEEVVKIDAERDRPYDPGGQAVDIARKTLRREFTALSNALDPDQANLRNEAPHTLAVAVDDVEGLVRVTSMERVSKSGIDVRFEVTTASRSFDIELTIESLVADVDHYASSELPNQVAPNGVVVAARYLLARYFLHWSSKLGVGDALI